MGIRISTRVVDQLREQGLTTRALLIDGSFWPKNVKGCGCCGPPPSQDYKVELVLDGDPRLQNSALQRVEARLPAFVNARLYEAARYAGQDFVVMVDESTTGEYRVYANVL